MFHTLGYPVIGAVVLAAGASSRMGRLKATLTMGLEGPTFLDTIAATLQASGVLTWRVVVSSGYSPQPANAVVNPDPSRGMLTSVQCGLRSFTERLDAALVWPVDHPLVKPETIASMIAAFEAGDAPVVVPTHGGRRGHPVLFAARVFPELLAADPSRGAREVVHAHDDRVELDVSDPGVRLTGIRQIWRHDPVPLEPRAAPLARIPRDVAFSAPRSRHAGDRSRGSFLPRVRRPAPRPD